MKIIIGSSNRSLGNAVLKLLKIKAIEANITSFADGESRIEINETLQNEETVFIFQSTNKDKFIIELLLIIDALKRLGVRKIIPIIPYFGYARQDRKVHMGSPVSAKVMADLLTNSGINALITIDIHFSQLEGFFNVPVYNLSTNELFAEYIKNNNLKENSVIVAPDFGSVKRAKQLANSLQLETVIINKQRPKAELSEITDIIGEVTGKNCLIIDDLICGGRTLCNAALKLKELGANSVGGFITHGVLAGQNAESIIEKISNSSINELVITDSIESLNSNSLNSNNVANKGSETTYENINKNKIKIISTAMLIAKHMASMHQ